MLEIREYRESDWRETWPILEEIVRAGDTYTFSPQSTEEEVRKAWVEVPAKTFIACDSEGRVLGTYFIKPNQPGLGAHVCNCGYVVPAAMQGRGIASRMCEHSQAQALAMGFRAMQFNFVVSTNTRAIRLWKRLGFSVVGGSLGRSTMKSWATSTHSSCLSSSRHDCHWDGSSDNRCRGRAHSI